MEHAHHLKTSLKMLTILTALVIDFFLQLLQLNMQYISRMSKNGVDNLPY